MLGYWVSAGHRRQGLASEALLLVSRWAAENLGLTDQELVHDVVNVASCRTALSAGFRTDRVIEGGGRRLDGSPRTIERHVWSSNERATAG